MTWEEPAREPRPKAQKSFDISKWAVKEAYEKVKANAGAAGVDEVSLQRFDENLKGNLYKIWNRMSSGTYFPPPVLAVEIPKKQGGVRTLGVPTVSDRVAQTVVTMALEPDVEPIFHADSYGYRPRRSALDAVAQCRERCKKLNWVIDLDIRSFFDSIDHDLLMRAVSKHTEVTWILLYIRRWLSAPLQKEDGSLVARDRGTPQGSAISPLLANLFLHYVFDKWMEESHPNVPFERYADDGAPRTKRRNRCRRSRPTIRCCVRDGGGPSTAALQGEAVNHRMVRRSRAGVLSVADKAGYQPVRWEPRRRAKANHSMTRRKRIDDIKTGESRCSGMSLVDTCLLTRWCPASRWRELGSGSGTERGNLLSDTGPAVQLGEGPPGWRERDLQVAETTRSRVAMRKAGADRLVLAMKVL
jgi:retron-type reverse transcriptase